MSTYRFVLILIFLLSSIFSLWFIFEQKKSVAHVGVEDEISRFELEKQGYQVVGSDLVLVDEKGQVAIVQKDLVQQLAMNQEMSLASSIEIYSSPKNSNYVYLLSSYQTESYGHVWAMHKETKEITKADWMENSLEAVGFLSPDKTKVFAVSKDGKNIQLYNLINNTRKDFAYLSENERYIAQQSTEIGGGPTSPWNSWKDDDTIEVSVYDSRTIDDPTFTTYRLKEKRTIPILY